MKSLASEPGLIIDKLLRSERPGNLKRDVFISGHEARQKDIYNVRVMVTVPGVSGQR